MGSPSSVTTTLKIFDSRGLRQGRVSAGAVRVKLPKERIDL